MSQHDGLVHYILRRQSSGELSYGESLQAGRIGLWRAIMGFEPERGTSFSTYASVSIARHIWQAVSQGQREEEKKRTKIELEPSPDPPSHYLEQEVYAELEALVGRLPSKRSWIVRSYYGLEGEGAHTQAELAEELGCTQQAVGYHLRKALLHLRHPAFSATLRALVGRNRRQDYLQALRGQRGEAT
jgi:RNA polymerase sporulation-specific sigma factor